ncbi:thiol reductant ABC exporter subunit CydC [Aneurinibacillus aneurinilyticus]|uniref:thiol reductant ABC exporter subunit CydC n=1 Tax=Aneurinibacillus aneurinilyticus TaxID=1391 RepID=UPI002E21C0CC|nr:thiol reductant ABC exporter subunit CydC [Aneurinibacillus aneurinilyticus]MED0671280.1 thiol reductant ABC exporter subunit CydC [Aneurinibacillus aneurinilyticus]
MKQMDRYITPYMKRYSKQLSITILFGLATVLSGALLMFVSGYLISRAAERPETILLIYVPIVAVRTFGISKAVTRYIERLIGHDAVLKILSDMRVKLYDMLEPQALFVRSRFQVGDLLGTLADDIEHLQDVYIRTVFPTVLALVLFIASILSLTLFDWKFAIWVALCLGVILFVFPLCSLYLLRRKQIDYKKRRAHLYRQLTDAVFGLSDWLISGKQQFFLEQFTASSAKMNAIDKKMRYWSQYRAFLLQVVSGIILVSVAIWAGNKAGAGDIYPAYIAAFTLVVLPILEALVPVSAAVEKIPAYEESMQRIDDIRIQMPEQQEQGGVVAEEVNEGIIDIRQVSYRYPGEERLALQNISLTIPHGQKIAIIGKSGAGKTTLLQLLQGILSPLEGTVSINGCAAQAYRDKIHERIAVLNQKPYLFATTVANNIRLGDPTATPEDIARVAEQVKLNDYLASLENGFDTHMEEAGQRFSGGERQRIALARILLKNTPIVILDEPTIGLDPKTERDLLRTMFNALQGKTIIWITHHLIGVENMDDILFMDQGRIIMQGTHKELLQTSSRYRNLYELDRPW